MLRGVGCISLLFRATASPAAAPAVTEVACWYEAAKMFVIVRGSHIRLYPDSGMPCNKSETVGSFNFV